jgi:hypothetical protein
MIDMNNTDEGKMAVQHILRASALLHSYLSKIPEDAELSTIDVGYANLYVEVLKIVEGLPTGDAWPKAKGEAKVIDLAQWKAAH